MRAVFIFVVILVLLSLAVPVTFAVQLWMDGQATLARAERSGALHVPPAGQLSTAERTIAMHEFRETWRGSAIPCRTFALLWADLTEGAGPRGMPVSHKVAASVLGEQRGTSVRWQLRRLVVACQLEQRFDDRQLLRMWLEEAYFGRGATGVEGAAQAIFGKPSSALGRGESARLAALLRAPGLRANEELWAERARVIEERANAR